jgi:hypothetical protein
MTKAIMSHEKEEEEFEGTTMNSVSLKMLTKEMVEERDCMYYPCTQHSHTSSRF